MDTRDSIVTKRKEGKSLQLLDLLREEFVLLNRRPASKNEALLLMTQALERGGVLEDSMEFLRCVLQREQEGTTGVGDGVAIPHARSPAVRVPALAAMTVPEGVEFDALDGQPVRLLFLIATPPEKGSGTHLEVLSSLAALLMESSFRETLERAGSPEEFRYIVEQAEHRKTASSPSSEEFPRVLAVTACPTGIAHTYMAAEQLEKASARHGISVKVETNGAAGRRNVLTDEEIRACEGIIVAADAAVELDRFRGKPVLFVPVSEAIRHPDKLLFQAVSGEIPNYEGGVSTGLHSISRIAHTIYSHLMNGVSHMLPFVIGGGLLIALAYLVDSILAPDGPALTFGSNSALAYFLKEEAGEVAFGFMLPVLSGYIAKSIADRPGLVVGFVAGALAGSGGGGFLGALLAGFLAGYVMQLVKRMLRFLPAGMEGAKPVLFYPVIGLLAVCALTVLVLDPPISHANAALTYWLSSLDDIGTVALGVLLAAMMSVDMGGPVNKAAYVFATASLVDAAGNPVSSPLMASVMLGGMVPPLAIALATVLFRSRFTTRQHQTGMMNFIMGLSFITEGAIPFAASDLRVIPACMLGSAVAGGISAYFRCTLQAPHGGIFVFALVPNWPMYFVALAAGTLISALALGLMRHPDQGKQDEENGR